MYRKSNVFRDCCLHVDRAFSGFYSIIFNNVIGSDIYISAAVSNTSPYMRHWQTERGTTECTNNKKSSKGGLFQMCQKFFTGFMLLRALLLHGSFF